MSMLDLVFAEGQAPRPDGKWVPLHSNISRPEADLLQTLVGDFRPQRTLEVGFAMGVSALAILEAEPRVKHHIAIDPMQHQQGHDGWSGVGHETVRRGDLLDRFTLVEKPSHVALPEILDHYTQRAFDLILIDGWHSFDNTFIDYFYSDLLLDDGGILVFDDEDLDQVRLVVNFAIKHKFYTPIVRQDGMVALEKQRTTIVHWTTRPEICP